MAVEREPDWLKTLDDHQSQYVFIGFIVSNTIKNGNNENIRVPVEELHRIDLLPIDRFVVDQPICSRSSTLQSINLIVEVYAWVDSAVSSSAGAVEVAITLTPPPGEVAAVYLEKNSSKKNIFVPLADVHCNVLLCKMWANSVDFIDSKRINGRMNNGKSKRSEDHHSQVQGQELSDVLVGGCNQL
ncbi:hypothetical protein KIN20_033467 [Parelaphostrongylus tenuis]|uniref:Uncharacterized protein n=1 Tax=Parelaphostrongylus tenuis TaxID=148309 RepID=A0AAD5R857_PARTN|nr:hypothetical protein KIN20_033467 [Parelaphostrongylus tenuis]